MSTDDVSAPAAGPSTLEEFRAEARKDTTPALDTIRGAMKDEDSKVRLSAAKTMLEFAWGKPAMSVQHSFDGGAIRHKVFHLTLTDDTGVGAEWMGDSTATGGDPDDGE